MALGYCMVCAKLCPIRKGPPISPERRCDYYPIEHSAPDGSECNGHKRAIK